MAEAGLSLGSNLGDRRELLDEAVARLVGTGRVRLKARSSFYKTEPWGDLNQDWFLNIAVIVETSLAPRRLLELCLAVETGLGRWRSLSRPHGPRSIDVDLLFYDDLTIDEPGLTVPHPRLFLRGFVLVPLAEIAPDRVVAGRRIGDAAREVAGQGIELWRPDEAD